MLQKPGAQDGPSFHNGCPMNTAAFRRRGVPCPSMPLSSEAMTSPHLPSNRKSGEAPSPQGRKAKAEGWVVISIL